MNEWGLAFGYFSTFICLVSAGVLAILYKETRRALVLYRSRTEQRIRAVRHAEGYRALMSAAMDAHEAGDVEIAVRLRQYAKAYAKHNRLEIEDYS